MEGGAQGLDLAQARQLEIRVADQGDQLPPVVAPGPESRFLEGHDGFEQPGQRRAGQGITHGNVDVLLGQDVQHRPEQAGVGQHHGRVVLIGQGGKRFLQGLELGVQVVALEKLQMLGAQTRVVGVKQQGRAVRTVAGAPPLGLAAGKHHGPGVPVAKPAFLLQTGEMHPAGRIGQGRVAVPEKFHQPLAPQGLEQAFFGAGKHGETAGENAPAGQTRGNGRSVFRGQGQGQARRGQTFAEQPLAVAHLHGAQARKQGGGRGQDHPVQVVQVLAGYALAEQLLHEFGQFQSPGEKTGHVRGERRRAAWVSVRRVRVGRGLGRQLPGDLVEQGHPVQGVEHDRGRGRKRQPKAGQPVVDGDDFRQEHGFGQLGQLGQPVAQLPGGPAQGKHHEHVAEIAARGRDQPVGHTGQEILGPGNDMKRLHEAGSTGWHCRASR